MSNPMRDGVVSSLGMTGDDDVGVLACWRIVCYYCLETKRACWHLSTGSHSITKPEEQNGADVGVETKCRSWRTWRWLMLKLRQIAHGEYAESDMSWLLDGDQYQCKGEAEG